MTDQLPAPLVPADVDLRGLEYMPFFGNHLFGSEFNARCTDSEWRAGVTLWWAAWNQVPAGSLPNDDVALTRLADLGRDIKAWRKVKERALHGFIECADGRLYHRFIATQALVAWEKRVKEREKKRRWREGRDRDNASRPPGQEPGQTPGRDGDKAGDTPGDGTADVTRRDGTGRDSTSKPEDLRSLSGSPPDAPPLALSPDPPKRVNGSQHYADAEDVLGYLNRASRKGFEFRNRSGELTASAERIIARLKQGYTKQELREVVHAKCEQWRDDERMAEYLRPATLFAKENFEQYLGELRGGNG